MTNQNGKNLAFASSLRGFVSSCHCEERSDEAISVGQARLPRTLRVLAMTGRRNAGNEKDKTE